MKQDNLPGDIVLVSADITSSDGSKTYSFLGQLQSFSIYEDIEFPVVTGEFTLVDSLNIIKRLPIVGEETIEISFRAPFRDITTYKLSVYSIDGHAVVESAEGAVYTLKCVSEEQKINATHTVDKSYTKNIHEIVSDLLLKEIGTKKDLYIEETKGIHQIVLPKINPYSAIDMLRQRAIGKSQSGGVFVFYETQDGIYFKTLESLIKEAKETENSFTFTYSPTVNTVGMDNYKRRNLLQFQHLSKFSTFEKAALGVFKSFVKSFDIKTKNVRVKEYDITKDGRLFELSMAKGVVPNTEKFIKSIESTDPFTFFMPIDSSRKNDYMHEYLSYKNAFTTLFNQNVVRCLTYGDSYLAVGDHVTLRLPNPSGLSSDQYDEKAYSGKYIVTKLRHMVELKQGRYIYHNVFDCNMVGVNNVS